MLDLHAIRSHPETIDNALAKRGHPTQSKLILELDLKHRHTLTELQAYQSNRNLIAKEFAKVKQEGGDVSSLTKENEVIKKHISILDELAKQQEKELHDILAAIPNLPSDDCPDGTSEANNVEVGRYRTPPQFSFTPQQHFDLGEKLGYMDFERATKLAGSRFVVLYSDLALLERAIAQFMLDQHCQNFGYTEVLPPVLVNEKTMFGTGQLPKLREDMFVTDHGLWLIPTSEVVLTNLVADEIIKKELLPLRFTAYTNCFRAEAGAAGRDTRGMIRHHQFSKVELVSITTPEQSNQEHEKMTSAAEAILKALELPYRKMLLCAGDIGFSAQKTYDLEVWLPGQNTYREISSCSNCGDFQARRMNARFRPHGADSKPQFVNTLNGSGLAVGRTLVAIMENYQNKDGSIRVPNVLIPYMRGKTIIKSNS